MRGLFFLGRKDKKARRASCPWPPSPATAKTQSAFPPARPPLPTAAPERRGLPSPPVNPPPPKDAPLSNRKVIRKGGTGKTRKQDKTRRPSDASEAGGPARALARPPGTTFRFGPASPSRAGAPRMRPPHSTPPRPVGRGASQRQTAPVSFGTLPGGTAIFAVNGRNRKTGGPRL